jgi:Protein of unknown function (DUF2809)
VLEFQVYFWPQSPGRRRGQLVSETMKPRPISHSVVLILVTIITGLAARLAPLGLPPFVVKYAGSALWAVMIYWITSTLLPFYRPLTVALISATVAAAVEFFKLYHSPVLDAFRLTLPGILLLGKYFSVWDIVAYWIAISVGAFCDSTMRQSR